MHWPVTESRFSGKISPEYVAVRLFFPVLLNTEVLTQSVQTWRGMEELLTTGRVRQIGVSNFAPEELRKILQRTKTKPAVHQMELHPYLQQVEWVQWHKDNDINVTAYSPLANLNPTYGSSKGADDAPPSLLDNQDISNIAKKRGCTNAQVALAWGIGRGTSVIPKSSRADHIRENFAASDCGLEEEDYTTIANIEKEFVKRFNNPSKSWGVDLFDGLEDV